MDETVACNTTDFARKGHMCNILLYDSEKTKKVCKTDGIKIFLAQLESEGTFYFFFKELRFIRQ